MNIYLMGNLFSELSLLNPGAEMNQQILKNEDLILN